jgi:hypothetical protein
VLRRGALTTLLHLSQFEIQQLCDLSSAMDIGTQGEASTQAAGRIRKNITE